MNAIQSCQFIPSSPSNSTAGINWRTDKIDLVLDLTLSSKGGIECGYYFAHLDTKTIFWIDKFLHAHDRLWPGLNGVDSNSHICECSQSFCQALYEDFFQLVHEINAQYWTHCSLFSCNRHPSLEVALELRDILSHAVGGAYPFPTVVFQSEILYSHYTLRRCCLIRQFSCAI